MRKKHTFEIGDEVALVAVILEDPDDQEEYCGSFPLKNYSHLGYNGYKEGDEVYQNEVGIITGFTKNPNEVIIQITETATLIAPYFCLLILSID